jgi:hypothetical protein
MEQTNLKSGNVSEPSPAPQSAAPAGISAKASCNEEVSKGTRNELIDALARLEGVKYLLALPGEKRLDLAGRGICVGCGQVEDLRPSRVAVLKRRDFRLCMVCEELVFGGRTAEVMGVRRAAYDSTLPPRFRDADTIGGVEPPSRGDVLEEWLVSAPRPWCLYLWGPPGTGKTYAACALLRSNFGHRVFPWARAMAELWGDDLTDYPGRVDGPMAPEFLSFRDVVAEARALRPQTEAHGTPIGTCLKYDGLIAIDDINADLGTAFVRELACRVVNRRYESMWPTIFTSNNSPAELAAVAPSIASRVSEGTVMHLTGSDRRLVPLKSDEDLDD